VVDRITAIGGLCDSKSIRQNPFFLMRNGVTLSESHRLDTVNAWWEQFLPNTPAPSSEFMAAATGGSVPIDSEGSISVMLARHKKRGFLTLPRLQQLCLVYLLGRMAYLAWCPSLAQLCFLTLNLGAFLLTCFCGSCLFWTLWPTLGEPEEFANAELRRMARMASGRLLLVPPTAQPSDVVALCRGGVVPLVLRPVCPDPDTDKISDFELVGECYVYGMMDPSKWVFERSRSIILV